MKSWGFEIHFDFYDWKDKPFLCKFGYQKTMCAEILRARSFEILDVVGVIHDPYCIRIFIINANIQNLTQPQVDCLDHSGVTIFKL